MSIHEGLRAMACGRMDCWTEILGMVLNASSTISEVPSTPL